MEPEYGSQYRRIFRSSSGTYGLEPFACVKRRTVSILAKDHASDDILTQSFGMERSNGVCRSDIRPSHRRVRSPRNEVYFVGKTWTPVGYGGDALPIQSLCITAKGATPNPALNETPRTEGALHRWSVPITSETHASISVESKRLPHCFLPIMDAFPSVGGFKNPGLSRVRGVAACYQPLLSHMAAQSLDQLLARLFTPTGHRVFPNYFR